MSRGTLFVKFPDGEVRYGIYNGTSDIAQYRLFDTSDEAWEWWTSGVDFPEVEEGAGEPVDVATNYGGGFGWRATATRDLLTSGHGPWELEDFDYKAPMPDWARRDA